MNLSFLNPGLAFAALFAALPILVHLLNRRRPRPRPFAAIALVLRSQKRNARRLKLRQLLLLAARMAVLGAIGFALGRPELVKPAAARVAQGPAATAIVIDASFSMRYRIGGETLFSRAQTEAERALDALSPDAPATVLLCSATTEPAAAPHFDRAAQRRIITEAIAGYRVSDMTGCMASAAHALGESPLAGKRIVVLTNLAATSLRLDAPTPRVTTPHGEVQPEVALIDVAHGAALPNTAVIDVAVEAAAAQGARQYSVTATVANFSDRALTSLPVALKNGGRVISKGYVDLPAKSTAKKVLGAQFDSGPVEGSVEISPDASVGELPDDDLRAFALRVPRDLRTLLVDGAPNTVKYRDAAYFVETALAPQRSGHAAPVVLDADAAAAQTTDLTKFDVVFLVDIPAPSAAFAGALRAFVQGGGGLFLSLGERVEPDAYNAAFAGLLPQRLHLVKSVAENVAGAAASAAHFARADWNHPLLQVFSGADRESLTAARTTRYFLLQAAAPVAAARLALSRVDEGQSADSHSNTRTILAYDDGSPALVEARYGAGRVVLDTSTVDRSWSDLAIRTAFLPIMQQLALYLGGALSERENPPALLGETREVLAPQGAQVTAVLDPKGDKLSLANGKLPPLALPGIYRVQFSAAPQLAFACGTEPRASDTTRVDAKELAAYLGEGNAALADSAQSLDPSRGRPLWTAFLALAVLAFLGEGLLMRR